MTNKFIFLLQESLISIVRTKVPSIVASLAIGVSLLVLSVAYCLFISFENLTLKFKDRYTIEVFFLEEIKEGDAVKEFNIARNALLDSGNGKIFSTVIKLN